MRDFTEDLKELHRRLEEAEGYLRIDALRARRAELEPEVSRPDLWDDPDHAASVQRELAGLSEDIDLVENLTARLEDVETLFELAREEGDESLEAEIAASVDALRHRFDDVELRALFAGRYDEKDAVCEINSGAGGTDSQDWAEMLLRMYLRWAERRGLEVELDEVSAGQEAGISSATFIVKGRHAFGLLQSEHGVHRLVRISPFDANARRHTAFASVTVTPFIEAAVSEVEIDPKDLRIDTYRSSGAGGQHVNVTDSAVRITHLPTNVVVSCQNQRSQHQNKERAMQILAAKLLERQREEQRVKLAQLAGDRRAVEWGSQIRSYVLQPYQMVKDVRTDHEVGNIEGVLDGDIDGFMEAYLRWNRARGGSTG